MPNMFLKKLTDLKQLLGKYWELPWFNLLVMMMRDTEKQEIQCLGQMPNELGRSKKQQGGGNKPEGEVHIPNTCLHLQAQVASLTRKGLFQRIWKTVRVLPSNTKGQCFIHHFLIQEGQV